jgi:hypothetical protein
MNAVLTLRPVARPTPRAVTATDLLTSHPASPRQNAAREARTPRRDGGVSGGPVIGEPAAVAPGGPTVPEPLPAELSRDLLRAIEARVGRCLLDFAVSAAPGRGLIVSGRTHRFFAKQVAQHLAARLTGLRVHANQIEVFRPGAAPRVGGAPVGT